MNQYGTMAQDHWRKYLPRRYQQIPDPETYFRNLGDEVAERVDELSRALEGEGRPGEGYLQRLGRLNMARLNAESQALQELALLPEETEEATQ